jgi:hypothetical protein
MNFFELTVLRTDDDGMFELAVRASSAAHAAYHETYLYPDSLASFADGLKSFPTATSAEVVLESGSKDPQWHDYFRIRVFLVKPTGQSALELESQVRGSPPVQAEFHFFIIGMPADFNRIGTELAAWLANPSDPLRVEWQNN